MICRGCSTWKTSSPVAAKLPCRQETVGSVRLMGAILPKGLSLKQAEDALTKQIGEKLADIFKEWELTRVVVKLDIEKGEVTEVSVTDSKGKKMASRDGVAINVDGGFAAAYYNRGHALVHTPYQLFGIILPTPEEMQEAAQNLESAPLDIELIDEFRTPMKIKDTAQGAFLQQQSSGLLKRIRELTQDLEL